MASIFNGYNGKASASEINSAAQKAHGPRRNHCRTPETSNMAGKRFSAAKRTSTNGKYNSTSVITRPPASDKTGSVRC